MSDFIKSGDLAGFDIGGIKLPMGKFRIHNYHGTRREINEFPAEITFNGVTYCLERVEEGSPYEDGIWVNAIYC